MPIHQFRQTGVAKIIVGIIRAMCHLHGCGVVHSELRPENIFLDWDWNVRIDDFGRSQFEAFPDIPILIQNSFSSFWPSVDWRCLAPDREENICGRKPDVFFFGMILYERLRGEPVIPKGIGRRRFSKG
jgi:serine/threonine protein kinase